MNTYSTPYLIELPKLGSLEIGFITPINTCGDLPFEIKRVFITYYTPDIIVRGRHAHYVTEQILVAVNGKIVVNTETAKEQPDNEKESHPGWWCINTRFTAKLSPYIKKRLNYYNLGKFKTTYEWRSFIEKAIRKFV